MAIRIGPGHQLSPIMSIEKATIKTLEGEEITMAEQTPIPCFRCGICCTRYQPPLTTKDIDNLAGALDMSRRRFIYRYAVKVPTREGYLLKRTDEGCIFLAWDADGKARCTIHASRPKACRDWTPSFSKRECLEGLASLKPGTQIILPEELLPSHDEQEELYTSLEGPSPESSRHSE